MEVKLSISSSRRISFASDFKEFDLEVEELDDDNCYQTYRYTGNDIFEEDDDDFDYVISCFTRLSSFWFVFCVAVKLN